MYFVLARPKILNILFISIFLCLTVRINSSQGDYDPSYISCTQHCIYSNCKNKSKVSKFGDRFPYWNCNDDCSYDCMQNITTNRLKLGFSPLKYNGHWPFIRYFGLEEPASVIFSLLNAIPYICALVYTSVVYHFMSANSNSNNSSNGNTKSNDNNNGNENTDDNNNDSNHNKINHDKNDNHKNKKNKENNEKIRNYYMHYWLILYFIISINTWFASAYFHSRKTKLASNIDYSSALLFLQYSLWLTTRRIWGVKADTKKAIFVFSIYFSLYVYQVKRLFDGFVSFDEHMQISISLAILNVITWLLWILSSTKNPSKKPNLSKILKIPKSSNKLSNYRYICLICQLWFSLAGLLELFDFSAIYGIFDAHSLWHAATVPLGFLWSYFWYLDTIVNMNKELELESILESKIDENIYQSK